MSPVAAFAAAALVATAGGRLGWLTTGGVLMASVVGGAVLEGSGWQGGALLAIFFVSGSLLTKSSRRAGLVPRATEGGPRDARQVAANGAWAAAGAFAIHTSPAVGWSVLTGALAAAQADTWATEIGARAAHAPRLITTGEPVEAGTSGGVTPLGTAGGATGAVVLAIAAIAVAAPRPAALAALLGGCIGMIADSLIGAVGEAVYAIDEPEGHGHPGPPQRRLVRGSRWCTNDVVNLLGSGAGAAVGLGLGWIWNPA